LENIGRSTRVAVLCITRKVKKSEEKLALPTAWVKRRTNNEKSGEFSTPAEGKKRNGDGRKSKPDGIKRKKLKYAAGELIAPRRRHPPNARLFSSIWPDGMGHCKIPARRDRPCAWNRRAGTRMN
jgi:hypothetical protein